MFDFNSLSKELSEGLNEMSLRMRGQSLTLGFSPIIQTFLDPFS